MINMLVIGVYTDNLEASKDFYQSLLDMEVQFEAAWIVQLTSPSNKSINLTLQPREDDLIPPAFRKLPQGASITFVVPDADVVYTRALEMGLEIVQEPKDEAYGQRRFLTVDPSGLLVDVSSECEPSAEFIAKYMS